MFPDSEIVGVELVEQLVDLARRRARFYDARNVSFVHNPDGHRLPDEVGDFDFVILSAVYEHLLPDERKALLPLIWARVRPGGILFINQLPHRYSPFEGHTTGLPLINYLPARWAALAARTFSRRVSDGSSWESMLRRGIRGGTASEILRNLDCAPNEAIVLEPKRLSVPDRIELWYVLSSGSRWPRVKRTITAALKAFRWLTGVTFVPELTLAIEKRGVGL
jgi:SAM-dependent methyltransferase